MTSPAAATIPKLTPMMEQYRAIKRTLPPETILFFRLGDFYEMFFEDALRGSEILDITLTGRDGGEAGRIPMCGIPYHAFQSYVKTLLDHRVKVAICEQIGDPKASRGLVERKVTRIITPATYLDEETKSNAAEYMVAVARGKDAFGLAWLDLGTGEFCVREIGPDALPHELPLIDPKELILPRSLAEDASLQPLFRQQLRAAITTYDDWIFDAGEALNRLRETFRLGSERVLGCAELPLATSAAGAIVYYLRDHLHAALDHVRLPRLVDGEAGMVLDRQTQRSLDLVANQESNGAHSLLACLDVTRTAMGSRALHQWVTHPLLSIPLIVRRQDAVEELAEQPLVTQTLRRLLDGIRDIERTLSRLNYGVANARDLLNLKLFLERVPELDALLRACRSELLRESAGTLNAFPELRDAIARTITDEPPLGLKDGGLIRDGCDAHLDALRELVRKGQSWLVEFQQREAARTGIKSLRVKYSNVFGYALEVTTPNLPLVPADYVRRQTLANAERFITPELREWDQRISGAEERIKAQEYALFQQLRETILAKLRPLQDMAAAIGCVDALHALAQTASQRQWTRPTVSDSTELCIESGRHPVVENALGLGEFVANDTELDTQTQQLVILTGPNMAGKSTYIRQVGLIVLLAQIGSFVPAKRARIGLVDRIFTRIGASDNLAAGESTFMVEMIETAQILHSATSRSLLILDEVGRGTSTFDGVSIAWAICEHLIQGRVRPRTLFATHYHELTQLEERLERVRNYTMAVKETNGGIVFLRKVARGASDKSYGLHVAALAGIPSSVTQRAEAILRILEAENRHASQIIEPQENPAAETRPAGANRDPGAQSLAQELRGMDLNQLTPLQALTLLAEWKKRLENP